MSFRDCMRWKMILNQSKTQHQYEKLKLSVIYFHKKNKRKTSNHGITTINHR